MSINNKGRLIELSNDLENLIGELHSSGAWRDVWESMSCAHEALLEQIEEEENDG